MIMFDYRKPVKELFVSDVKKIDTVYLHNSGNNNSIWTNTNYHLDDKKWNWLGYGYYLASGKVYWVRGYEYVNAGVKNHNGHGVSICVEGNYDIEAPSEIDMVNLEALIIRLKKELPNLKHIKGHNEDYPTTCPGQYFPMDRFRDMLKTDEEYLTKREFKVFLDGYELQRKRMYRYINKN